jgi:hypothetical protein
MFLIWFICTLVYAGVGIWIAGVYSEVQSINNDLITFSTCLFWPITALWAIGLHLKRKYKEEG